jgi:hypothetical protein
LHLKDLKTHSANYPCRSEQARSFASLSAYKVAIAVTCKRCAQKLPIQVFTVETGAFVAAFEKESEAIAYCLNRRSDWGLEFKIHTKMVAK